MLKKIDKTTLLMKHTSKEKEIEENKQKSWTWYLIILLLKKHTQWGNVLEVGTWSSPEDIPFKPRVEYLEVVSQETQLWINWCQEEAELTQRHWNRDKLVCFKDKQRPLWVEQLPEGRVVQKGLRGPGRV